MNLVTRKAFLPFTLGAALCVTLSLSVSAETSRTIASCLAFPDEACSDVIFDRLTEIERETSDAEGLAAGQVQLVSTLAQAGQFDAAVAVLDRIQDSAFRPGIRDVAALEVISLLDGQNDALAQRLLDGVVSDYMYDLARGHYIASLARVVGSQEALAAVDATNRDDQPLAQIGLQQLLDALVTEGRTDVALQTLKQNTSGDAVEDDYVLYSVVDSQLAFGCIDAAEMLLVHFVDPLWQTVATSVVAKALAEDGRPAVNTLIVASQHLLSIPMLEQRMYAFQPFTRAAAAANRTDLALDVIGDLSSNKADRALALNSVAQTVVRQDTDANWRAILENAAALLEDERSEGNEPNGKVDEAWYRVSRTITLAGDVVWALAAAENISDEEWRKQSISDVAMDLIDAQRFEEAFVALAYQADTDLQVRGLLRLSRAAEKWGELAFAQRAQGMVIGMVEGPDWVPLSERTISELVLYEASKGRFGAEMHLRSFEDSELRINGQIDIMGFAAELGSPQEFNEYLQIALGAVHEIEDPDMRAQMSRNAAVQLAQSGKEEEALAFAMTQQDPEGRDAMLQSLSVTLVGLEEFSAAMRAVNAIADSVARNDAERLLLLSVLPSTMNR